jgi:hypothetical protein
MPHDEANAPSQAHFPRAAHPRISTSRISAKASSSWPAARRSRSSPSRGAGATRNAQLRRRRCPSPHRPPRLRCPPAPPRLLGSVWLPLPHILMLPFVQVYSWWANGFAGVIPSALAYLAACLGIYRLARIWLPPAAAALTRLLRRQSQSALPPNHRHDRAALPLRNGLDHPLASRMAHRHRQ